MRKQVFVPYRPRDARNRPCDVLSPEKHMKVGTHICYPNVNSRRPVCHVGGKLQFAKDVSEMLYLREGSGEEQGCRSGMMVDMSYRHTTKNVYFEMWCRVQRLSPKDFVKMLW